MELPNNPDFYAKLVISAIVVIGVIIVQTTTGSVPDWLSTAFLAVITFILGLTTTTHKD